MVMDGCSLHGITQDDVLKRWNHPAIPVSHDTSVCVCCWGPCKAVVNEDGRETWPGLGHASLCSHCKELTEEQGDDLMTRLSRGWPVPA